MKYYAQLVDMGCFTRGDIVRLTGNVDAANSLIYSYKKKGLIESVKRDLLVTISLETRQPIPSRYAIASHAAQGAYITHHSAFEYYGLANQVFFEVYAASPAHFRTFEYDGVIYRRVQPVIDMGVDIKKDGVRVTDMERTVLDSLCSFEKIGGLEEFLRCMDLVTHLNSDKLLSYLLAYGSVYLCQKAGYVLEHYKKQLSLSDSFFKSCRENITNSKRYLYNGLIHERHTLNKDWMLYVPEDLLAVTRKGGAYIE